MEILQNVVLVVHLLGWAALFGATVAQAREPEKRITWPMRDGIGTAVVAGLVAAGLLEAGDDPVDHAKIGVKLVVGLVVMGLVMANMRKSRISDRLFFSILGLTVLNVAVATLW
ncbi:MAG: hypothetical protein ACRCYQ_03460 [Nocardioides sp.]